MKIIHHTVNMPSVILVFFIEFVSLIWCVPLNVSKLNCFNDYVTTMVCDFTSDKFLNCSGYSLDFQSPIMDSYKCSLINSEEDVNYYRSKCGCTVELPEFVNAEEYIVNLTEGGKVINSTIITAVDNIKPKAPDILLVMPMENGNYKVTWNTNYPEYNGLSDNLEIQLSYKKKGEPDKVGRIVSASLPFHEIPGSDLEPSSEYVVKARSYSTHYNTQFSEWSREVEWTSPAPVGSVLKAVIPVLCVLLVINICALYWCLTRLKAKWWDKIPAPKNDIKNTLPRNFENFIPKDYDLPAYHTDLLTIDKTEEKPRPTPSTSESERDSLYKNVSSHVLAKDSGVFSSDGGLSDSAGSCSSSESSSGYKNVLYSRLSATSTQNGGSPELPGSGTPFFPAPPTPGCDIFPIYSEVEVLKAPSPDFQKTRQTPDSSRKPSGMTTDCKYCAASTPPGEESFSPHILGTTLLLEACGTITRADDGYESFPKAVSRAALGKANFPACTLEPCEDGYQDLRTILENRTDWHSEAGKADREASSAEGPEKSSGQERELSQCPKWDILESITSCASPFMQKSSMESSANPALTTCPIIQIYTDSSYHRV